MRASKDTRDLAGPKQPGQACPGRPDRGGELLLGPAPHCGPRSWPSRPPVTTAGAAAARALAAVITTLNQQIKALESQVQAHFRGHPDAEIILSQSGWGRSPGARVLAKFGDHPMRYATAKNRKDYAATIPITRQPGTLPDPTGRSSSSTNRR